MGVESGSMELRKRILDRTMKDEVILNGFKEFKDKILEFQQIT